MGIFDILFNSSSKPVVTEKEYTRMKSRLFNLGFSLTERNKVDEIFKGDYYEKARPGHPKGLEKGEIEARIKWMRENKSKHGFSDHRIDQIEEELNKRV